MISDQDKYLLRQIRRLGARRGGEPVPRSDLLDASTLEADLVSRLAALEAASLVVTRPPAAGDEGGEPMVAITRAGDELLEADAG